MDYAKAFRIVRAAAGVSQADVARVLGVGPSQVSLIEAGKRQPSHRLVQKLADVLRVPPALITLLASGSGDLTGKMQPFEDLAISLVELLAEASDGPFQAAPEDAEDD
jgi:transcriptional regulator with XRE-family HTH domain